MEAMTPTQAAGPAPIPPYLALLNPEQREAVFHRGKPLLILAGAGSGKTRVITTKIAYLIREQGVDPRSILAVTFTNRAAREMADRARLIDERAGDAMLRTFHSFGAWFLRRNGPLLGLNPGFVIYDDDDSAALLATIMENSSKAEVRATAHQIARAKDYFLSPEAPELDLINHRREFRRIYTLYEERLGQIGNVDFGDLIKKPVELLRALPEVSRRIRDRFRVIMVDEYQDSNIAQFELLKELCGPETYVCVVGDDDQSIYRFRGAEVRNILEFPDRFAGADIIRLERNYRSVAPILQVASSVVDHNEGRLGKTLRSERGPGKKPVLVFLPDQEAEAAFCAELIEKSLKERGDADQGALYSDWAILYRTNAQSLGFETEFLRRRIPYRVVGSLKFYEREEIKDALALLSFLVNPRDEVAFRRVVNKPSRGVGVATVDRILGEVAADPGAGGDLALAAERIMPALAAKARSGLAAFFAAIEKGRSALENTAGPEKPSPGAGAAPDPGTVPDTGAPAPEKKRPGPRKREGLSAGVGLSICVVRLIEDAGIAEYHLSHDDITGNQRINNLQELANAASLYPPTMEGLLEFLEHIELDRSIEQAEGADSPYGAVTLITLHNTKGLEFRRVVMTGIEQGVFPREDKKDEDLEEERRLFYVGATRAMDELYLSSCALRRMFGRTTPMEPSLFLDEVDGSLLRIIGQVPYGFSGAHGAPGSAAGLFSPGGFKTGPATARASGPPGAKSGGAPARSSDGRWQLGSRLFHDDHGYGVVVEIRESDEGPVIRARFETGKEVQFLSLHQSARFEKIGKDD
ncbi:MAG: ATP-dependent helicase [Treponema sp.]|jgi:DNA helicase-2/ATP-dependent DNA helicase PcrA|nr:ATP-dependent helicase [Treponema sp.]